MADDEQQEQRTAVLVYARRSQVASDSDRFNVDGQLAALRAEIAKRGYDRAPYRVEEYIDAKGHRSGRHEHTRPEWLKLRARLAGPDVLAILFYTIDRASRSVRDFADLIETCQRAGVGIISLIDGVDTLAGVGRRHLDLHLRAMIAQDESDLASERMKRRIALKRERGIPHGTPPFGTHYEGEGAGMRRVVNEHAPTVVQLMAWYADGASYRATMNRANGQGLRHVDRHGALEPFKLGAVQTIIANVLAYAGYLQHGPHTKRDKIKLAAGGGSLLDRFADAVGAVRSAAIEPVISDELACAVIERRLMRQRVGRQPVSQALLTHALWCEGRRVYSAARDGGRYRLHGRNSRSFAIDAIDGQILDRLAALRFSDALRAAIVAQVADGARATERDGLNARIAECEGRLNRLRDMYELGAIDRPDFVQRMADVNAVMSEARRALQHPGDVDAVMRHLTTLAETLNTIAVQHRRNAMFHLIERVDIDGAGAIERVTFRQWAHGAFMQTMHVLRMPTLRLENAQDRYSETNLAEAAEWFAERMPA